MPAVLLALLPAPGCGPSAERHHEEHGTLRLFAAASLTDVLEVLVDSFRTVEPNAPHVRLHVAGSSLLARQIEHGAGADVFVSAHPAWMDYLIDRGMIRRAEELPITNRLVVVARREGLHLRDADRLALADPEHVPAGIYAREALECDGLWRHMDGRIAATVDVRAALAAVEEGAADAAVVYASDAAFTPELHVSEPFPSACRPQISYRIGVARSAGPGADALADFLADARRGPVWERFGFATRGAHRDSVAR